MLALFDVQYTLYSIQLSNPIIKLLISSNEVSMTWGLDAHLEKNEDR